MNSLCFGVQTTKKKEPHQTILGGCKNIRTINRMEIENWKMEKGEWKIKIKIAVKRYRKAVPE